MNLLISLMTIAGWVSWGYIVVFLDPEAPLAPLAFYSTLFVALTCTLAQLLGGSSEGDSSSSSSAPCLGHAAAVTTIILFALWLQSLRMLTPLNGILMVATFLLIELGFRLNSQRRRPRVKRRLRRQPVSDPAAAGEQ